MATLTGSRLALSVAAAKGDTNVKRTKMLRDLLAEPGIKIMPGVYDALSAPGLYMEDQVFPKRCGHLSGKQVIPAEEMVTKVKAAVDARTDRTS